MKSALNRAQVSYLIGYYSTNASQDGEFRRIAVKVNRPNAIVTARKGYFAPKGDETFEVEQDSDIREALHNPEDRKDIPVSLSYHLSSADPSHALLAVLTHVGLQKIQFVNRENRYRNILTIVVAIYDSADSFVEGKQSRLDFTLTDSNYRKVREEGYVFQTNFQLSPGWYSIQAVVRDAIETKLGSASKRMEVPTD